MAEHASVELSEVRDGPEQVMTWESKEFSQRVALRNDLGGCPEQSVTGHMELRESLMATHTASGAKPSASSAL